MREARAEHNIAAAKVRAEFNSRVADFRNELFAKYDADVARLSETIAQLKAKYEKEVATLQRELAEARAEVSKLRTAKCERSETTGLN